MAKGKKGVGPLEEEDKPAKQGRLPEMEDTAIEEIEEAALTYAKIRDRRMALTDQEVTSKGALLTVMQKHKKMEYHRHTPKHGAIHVERKPEGEKLKVRVEEDD